LLFPVYKSYSPKTKIRLPFLTTVLQPRTIGAKHAHHWC